MVKSILKSRKRMVLLTDHQLNIYYSPKESGINSLIRVEVAKKGGSGVLKKKRKSLRDARPLSATKGDRYIFWTGK